MVIIKTSHYLAEYGCGTYSSGNYQGACVTSTGSSPLDTLANTGYDVLIPVFLGAALVFASAVLLMRKFMRKRKQQRTPAN
jgi:hypothetical protein